MSRSAIALALGLAFAGCKLEADAVGGSSEATGVSPTGDPASGDTATGPETSASSSESTGELPAFPEPQPCSAVDCTCEETPCNLECDQVVAALCPFRCPAGFDCRTNCLSGLCSTMCDPGSTCDIRCPDGECVATCADAERCDMLCGGSTTLCTLECRGTEACEVDCPAGGCQLECHDATTCRIRNCGFGCIVQCNGAPDCANSCTALDGCATVL